MKLRDIPSLSEGDVVSCTNCGCDGTPAKVSWNENFCGRGGVAFLHEGNELPFAYDCRQCEDRSSSCYLHQGREYHFATEMRFTSRKIALIRGGG